MDSNTFEQAELELASLQITQLQEELEYYFQAYQEAQSKGPVSISMATHQQKVFDKASAEALNVTGKYIDEGYQDIHLLLSQVQLADGREFAQLPVKLINEAGHFGIEFRDEHGENWFNYFDDSTDDYGPFLRYFAQPSEGGQKLQTVTNGRMIASERVLLMSSITLIAQLLQNVNISSEIVLSSEELRQWRMAAVELANHVDTLPNWLSFDQVTLKEEFQTDGYEHLWVGFDNVLVGNVWQRRLEVKLAATEISTTSDEPFSQNIQLVFRELEDGTAPLLTWPPEDKDEFGPKFVVPLNNLEALNALAKQDASLITHIVSNLPSIIEKLKLEQDDMKRPKAEWLKAVSALLDAQSQPEAELDAYRAIEEVVSMGSYQHIVFAAPSNDLKVKLKAHDINPDTFDAEIYLELRNGRQDVIYHDSEFYGEDEYGPRVLVPAEAMYGDIATNRQDEFAWLLNTFSTINTVLEQAEDVDELIKRLWLNTLKRKQSVI
jgi:hypothetical protein